MAEVRAAQLKEDLLALRALGNDAASRILADVPPGLLRRIERSTRVDWLPVELLLELTLAIERESGDEGIRLWGRSAIERSLSTSLLKPLLDAAVRIFGLSPATLLKAAPQAWRATFRGCGELTSTFTPGQPALVGLKGLPPILAAPAFLTSVEGGLESVFQTSGVAGTVRQVPAPPGLDAAFEARW